MRRDGRKQIEVLIASQGDPLEHNNGTGNERKVFRYSLRVGGLGWVCVLVLVSSYVFVASCLHAYVRARVFKEGAPKPPY